MEELIEKWDTDQKVLDEIDADEGHDEGEEEENVRMYVCTYVRMYVCTYVRMYA